MAADHDLAKQLLTLAGAIMEDASAVAIIGDKDQALSRRIKVVQEAADAVGKLVDAAEVALRYDLAS